MTSRRERELEDEVKRLRQEVDHLKAQGGVQMRGGVRTRYEYKSAGTWSGLPLVHICMGPDPQTGKLGVARGVVAIGDVAFGVIAIGSMACGGLCLGALTCGFVGFGGLAVGLLLGMGGLAIGGMAFGGLAIGGLALGGVALGYVAIGGAAYGVYAIGGEYHSVREFQQLFAAPSVTDVIQRVVWFLWELR